jgi:hypothetical protein
VVRVVMNICRINHGVNTVHQIKQCIQIIFFKCFIHNGLLSSWFILKIFSDVVLNLYDLSKILPHKYISKMAQYELFLNYIELLLFVC